MRHGQCCSRKPEVQRCETEFAGHRPSLPRGLLCSLASVPEVSPFGVCLPPGDGSGWLAQSDLDSLILVLGGDSVSLLPFAVPSKAYSRYMCSILCSIANAPGKATLKKSLNCMSKPEAVLSPTCFMST